MVRMMKGERRFDDVLDRKAQLYEGFTPEDDDEAIERAVNLGYKVERGDAHTLLLDLDTSEALEQFGRVLPFVYDRFSVRNVECWRSKSDNTHVRITLGVGLNAATRCALQAALGSDGVREAMTIYGLRNDCVEPSMLFRPTDSSMEENVLVDTTEHDTMSFQQCVAECIAAARERPDDWVDSLVEELLTLPVPDSKEWDCIVSSVRSARERDMGNAFAYMQQYMVLQHQQTLREYANFLRLESEFLNKEKERTEPSLIHDKGN